MGKLVLTGVGDLVENAALDTTSVPVVGPDEVLVAMEAATINPVDRLYAMGWYGVPPVVGGGLGAEGVGRVVRAGSDAGAAFVGRRVIILATLEQGTWADEVVVPVRNVVPIGDEGDAAQLAQLSINPATAYVLLLEYGSLRPGDWIGQTLGNSAVGRYVIQLAKRAGYRTLSLVRSEKAADQVRAAGGDLVVVSGADLAARVRTALDGRQLDLVLEGEGGETVGALASSLKDGGTVAMYSTVTGASPVLSPADLVYRGLRLTGWWLVTWLRTAPREEIEATYAELAELVAKGEISSPVEATYPLSAYREAIAHAAAPGRSGKILFTFDAGR